MQDHPEYKYKPRRRKNNKKIKSVDKPGRGFYHSSNQQKSSIENRRYSDNESSGDSFRSSAKSIHSPETSSAPLYMQQFWNVTAANGQPNPAVKDSEQNITKRNFTPIDYNSNFAKSPFSDVLRSSSLQPLKPGPHFFTPTSINLSSSSDSLSTLRALVSRQPYFSESREGKHDISGASVNHTPSSFTPVVSSGHFQANHFPEHFNPSHNNFLSCSVRNNTGMNFQNGVCINEVDRNEFDQYLEEEPTSFLHHVDRCQRGGDQFPGVPYEPSSIPFFSEINGDNKNANNEGGGMTNALLPECVH